MLRRYRLPPEDVAGIVMLTSEKGLRIDDPRITPVSRDPRDDIFVALAVAAGAEYLVSRDDDLKRDPNVVNHLAAAGCQVVTVRTVLERLAD
jgi:predicted nucleic acid-binding protein